MPLPSLKCCCCHISRPRSTGASWNISICHFTWPKQYFSLRKSRAAFDESFSPEMSRQNKPNQNFLKAKPHICEWWSVNRAASVRAVTFSSQPECEIIKKWKSIFLCAAFLVSKGTQLARAIPLSNQARKAWTGWPLKTHSYLWSSDSAGWEGWEGLAVGRQGGMTDPGRPSLLGESRIWLGKQSACSRPSLPRCGQGWVRLFTPDPPLLVHPVEQRLHPQLAASTDWLSIPLRSHRYHSKVAALAMGCWRHRSWSPQLGGDAPPAAVLNPLCPHGSGRDVFSLSQRQSHVVKGCSLSWDCIFALPAVFCHSNVS